MKGKLSYQTADPEMPNSIEGWFIYTDKPYLVSEGSVKKIKSGKYNIKDGDEVEFEIEPNCSVYEEIKVKHSVVARLLLDEDRNTKVFLIDIDGTICDDIKNEDSHLYPTANHFPSALQIIDNQEYVWIDNRKVRAITYLGTWSELKEVDAKIQTFE